MSDSTALHVVRCEYCASDLHELDDCLIGGAEHYRYYKADVKSRERAQREAIITAKLKAVWQAQGGPCPLCLNQDGSLNTDYLKREGRCATGCGGTVPWGEPGHGYCPSGGEHSANEVECKVCGAKYADWAEGKWEPA